MSAYRSLVSAVVILSFPSLLIAATPTQPEEQGEDFRFSFDDTAEVDFRSDTAELIGNVRVIQGANSIKAEEATATAFRSENKRFEFRDSVRIQTADAELASQTASAAFENNVLVEARAEGSPAQFQRRGNSTERLARGHAQSIKYDVENNLVTLTGNVWFSYGKDEFSGETVVYNMADERVRVNPNGESGRVKGVIRPRSRDDASSIVPRAQSEEAPSADPDENRDVASENGA